MLGVFLVHTYGYINSNIIRVIIVKIGLGNVVATFFVISGFLAFSSTSDESTSQYYMNRILRIYLIYWITYNINIFIQCFWLRQLQFNMWRYFIGLVGLQMAIPTHEYRWNGLGATGSLSAFIIFYLVVPILRRQIKSGKAGFYNTYFRWGGVCNFVRFIMQKALINWGESGHWLPVYSPQTNLWYFLIGIVMWFIKDHITIKYIFIEIMGMAFSAYWVGYDSYIFYSCCTALILSIYWLFAKKGLPRNKIMNFFNKIGYAFWLVHPIMISLVREYSELLKKVILFEFFDWIFLLFFSLIGAWGITYFTNAIIKKIGSRLCMEDKNT